MNKIINFVLLIFLFASCTQKDDYFIRTTFDGPFPKRNIDLSQILGDSLIIKSGVDTIFLNISSSKNYNLIKSSTNGDTIFHGRVSKFRGMYYFSQQIDDTSYYIYAVRLKDNLIFGLNTAWEQTLFIESAVDKGQYQNIVKYLSNYIIRLHSDKKALRA